MGLDRDTKLVAFEAGLFVWLWFSWFSFPFPFPGWCNPLGSGVPWRTQLRHLLTRLAPFLSPLGLYKPHSALLARLYITIWPLSSPSIGGEWSTMVHFTSWCNLARAPPPSRLLLISRRALEVNCRQVIFNLLLSFVTKLQTSENSSDLVYLPLP